VSLNCPLGQKHELARFNSMNSVDTHDGSSENECSPREFGVGVTPKDNRSLAEDEEDNELGIYGRPDYPAPPMPFGLQPEQVDHQTNSNKVGKSILQMLRTPQPPARSSMAQLWLDASPAPTDSRDGYTAFDEQRGTSSFQFGRAAGSSAVTSASYSGDLFNGFGGSNSLLLCPVDASGDVRSQRAGETWRRGAAKSDLDDMSYEAAMRNERSQILKSGYNDAYATALTQRPSTASTIDPSLSSSGGVGLHAGVTVASDDSGPEPVTTLMISRVPLRLSSESFQGMLDSLGAIDLYDFFLMPLDKRTGEHMGLAIVNMLDAAQVPVLMWAVLQTCLDCHVEAARAQGYENTVALWGGTGKQLVAKLRAASKQQSQHIKGQLRKTKMCVFFKKNKCALGQDCPFAHAREELQVTPDLSKTKLCYNYFRSRCFNGNCRFAHGYEELRATENVYKTELCRWSALGWCKVGKSCRYAHTVDELRGLGKGVPSES